MDFSRSDAIGRRLAEVVPGGAHTYAKGRDQFPTLSPSVISHGRGCRVWDADGNEFIEYGMGLRSVGLGHGFPAVVDAVRSSLELGTNFTRPSVLELEAAERFLQIIRSADMVKFTKDGSSATSAALKLARRATGRDMVAICADHPFFSYDDWFIGTTSMDGGVSAAEADRTVGFAYNDLESLRALFDRHDGRIAAVFLEAVRTDSPTPGFLEGVREVCSARGSVLVFDEMITGFRYDMRGAQHLFDVRPDLSTFGKALANGFALSALAGDRDLMRLGSRERADDDVFLLSTTHGAETPGLAAGIATLDVYETEPVVDHLYRQGQRLIDGFNESSRRHGLIDRIFPVGYPCNLLFATLDASGAPSQALRSLFMQETARRGVLMPSLVVSYAHTDDDVEATLQAIDAALEVCGSVDDEDYERVLVGPPSTTVMDRRFRA